MMLYAIQAYRGLAVLLVVFFHGSIIVAQRYGVPPFFNVFSLGFSGVYLFFVLSGFIILTAHAKDIGDPRRLAWYAARRLIRIYPIYWLLFLVWGGWKLVSIKPDPAEFLRNAFLFMSSEKLVIPVSWTLLYEIIFYALFAVLVINKRIGMAVFGIWFLAILAHWGTAGPHILHPFNLLFVFGLTAAAVSFQLRKLRAGARRAGAMAGLVLGIIVFLGTAAYYSTLPVAESAWPEHPVAILGFGLGSALLVLASASESIDRFFRQRHLVALIGNASYSIYLAHIQFEKIAFNAVKSVGWIWKDGERSSVIADLLLVYIAGVAVLCGVIIHLKIERPLLAFLRGKLNSLGRAESQASLA
jgi:exopolysaccharide production protein ExoZ